MVAADADALQLLVLDAVSEVLPLDDLKAAASLPKERVRPAQQGSSGADFLCHAPVTLFRRLEKDALEAEAAPPDPDAGADSERLHCDGPGARKLPGGGVSLVTLTSLGSLRHREYPSAAALAEDILSAVPPAALSALIADARVAPDGTLRFLTWRALAERRQAGLLLCPACGKFFPDGRGMRDHQQIVHTGRSYEAALGAAMEARRALVPHRSGSLQQQQLMKTPAGPAGDTAAEPASSNTSSNAPRIRGDNRLKLEPGLAAARDGDLPALKAAVAAGFDPAASTDRHGSCALLWAAGGGHTEVCRYLVEECGVPADAAQARDGRNAVHWAARNGKTDTLRWLVEVRGLSADTPTRDGTTALHWCIWQGHLETAAWLVDTAKADLHHRNGYGCNAVQWAAQRADPAACAWLRGRGLDLHLLNRNGHSALHKAAVAGAERCARWLVDVAGLGIAQLGADGDGNTPAEMARLEGHEALAAWLAELAERLRRETAAEEDAAAAAAGGVGRGTSDAAAVAGAGAAAGAGSEGRTG